MNTPAQCQLSNSGLQAVTQASAERRLQEVAYILRNLFTFRDLSQTNSNDFFHLDRNVDTGSIS